MKKFLVSGSLFLVLAAGALAGAGCNARFDQALYDQEVTAIPGQVLGTNTVMRTNLIVNPLNTNELKQVVTPEIVIEYAPPTYVTNLVPRATIDGGLEAVGLLPFPYAGTAAIGLGWLYHFYASVRNRKVGAALVKSVEAGRRFIQTTPEGQKLDEKFVEILKREQGYEGAVTEVRKLLDQYVHKAG